MTSRAQVVQEARSYIGTEWTHQGRSRDGVDCLGLLLCVAWSLGLSAFDYRAYGFANDPQLLFDLCDEHMERIEFKDAQPGDVVTVSYLKVPHHLAILGDYPHGGFSMIHALNLWNREVVEHRLDEAWQRRIVRTYRIPGVE